MGESIAKLLRGYDEDDGEEDGKKRQVEGHFKQDLGYENER